jgi:hypothetical protein
MAKPSPLIGSGREMRPDLISTIGPTIGEATSDPVTGGLPARLEGVSGGLSRLQGVRVINPGVIWQAVGLRLRDAALDSRLFEITLSAGDGRCVVVATLDEDEVIAAWRALGQRSGLPLMLETADGEISFPYPQIGRVALGALHVRRIHGFLRGRRPRFLARRKPGRMTMLMSPEAGEPLSDGAGR